jgi:hypothetical protein
MGKQKKPKNHVPYLFLENVALHLAAHFSSTKININMEAAKLKIDRIIAEGYDFRFGDYIGKGFNLFQKEAGMFIGFTVVFFMLYFVIALVPFIGIFADGLVVMPALIVGMYLVSHKTDIGQRAEFGDFFKGFDFTGQLAIATLVMWLIMCIAMAPLLFMYWKYGMFDWYMDFIRNPADFASNQPPRLPGWVFLLELPAIFLGLAYSWTYLFIAFYKMEFWDALEASRRLITKKWFHFFAFMLVVGMILAAGFILFCIGILVTFPAAMCMTYAAFADVTRLNEVPGEGAGIEEHLIE